jgi:hypothetical protein
VFISNYRIICIDNFRYGYIIYHESYVTNGEKMAISNTEKQERFRKKEELKKYANNIFRDWQFMGWSDTSRTPQEVREYLEKIADLPSGWNKDDYNQAVKSLETFQKELYFGNPYLLQNDVYAGRDSIENLMTTSNPAQLVVIHKKALENMKALSAHVISAINLAGGTSSDNAAALMEVVRHIGRSLVKENKVPKSKATAMCLASIGHQFERPDWLIEELTQTLGNQLGEELTHKLGESLKKFKEGV